MTPQLEARLFEAIRRGAFRRPAAQYAGISEATLYRWLANKGRRFREFRERFLREEAALHVRVVADITKSVRRHPAVGLRMLALRDPEHWGPQRLRHKEDCGCRCWDEERSVDEGTASVPQALGRGFGFEVLTYDQMPGSIKAQIDAQRIERPTSGD